ncbi:MAG: hypothetical protein HYR55_11425 [Acidobacteria bacterium]|nr:hypothetical protein [Acidobacteriota bacterium]
MKAKRVYENYHERKASAVAPSYAASPPGGYAKAAAEAATRYLQEVARARGECPEAEDLIFQGQAESLPGCCPHCRYAYQQRSTQATLWKARLVRRDDRTGRLSIKCRSCKRWIDLSFIA